MVSLDCTDSPRVAGKNVFPVERVDGGLLGDAAAALEDRLPRWEEQLALRIKPGQFEMMRSCIFTAAKNYSPNKTL